MQDINGPETPGAQGTAGADVIHHTDMSTFMKEVIEQSTTVPVMVSFYADWSENCKSLNPLLEKLVLQAGGAIHLCHINIDQNQQLASQMQIQSVPTVVLFKDGRPLDAFGGMKNEAEIKDFMAKHIGEMAASPVEQIIEQAQMAFSAEDFQSAGALYSEALQAEAGNPVALAGLGQCLIRLEDLDNATSVLDSVEKSHENHADILQARAALDMARQLADLGDVDQLKAAIADNADDFQARFDLALCLWARGAQDEAAAQLLEIIARDRSWNEDGARKQLVKFFEVAGQASPFAIATRKKLSSLLFS